MKTLIVTIVVTVDDAGKAAFQIVENVGNNLEVIQILQTEIGCLEKEWKTEKVAEEQNAAPAQ